MIARLFTAAALHRFMDTTKCPYILGWNLINIRGRVFQLPPSLAAPSDPPSAGPPSPETNPDKGSAFNDHPSSNRNPARATTTSPWLKKRRHAKESTLARVVSMRSCFTSCDTIVLPRRQIQRVSGKAT